MNRYEGMSIQFFGGLVTNKLAEIYAHNVNSFICGRDKFI